MPDYSKGKHRLAGLRYDFVIMDEVQDIDPKAWDTVLADQTAVAEIKRLVELGYGNW